MSPRELNFWVGAPGRRCFTSVEEGLTGSVSTWAGAPLHTESLRVGVDTNRPRYDSPQILHQLTQEMLCTHPLHQWAHL